MAGTLIHRGPDEDGFYSDEKVSLGIRRLSIVDVETGHQPVRNEDGSVWAVFNGEIYNFHELRSELEAQGHQFYTHHSDSEVIVHLYEQHGMDFLHRLNGMFAIALWDKRSGYLHLVRDRMGVKPLFYTVAGNSLIFGSEIKAILAHPLYNRRMNHDAVYHYFTFKNIPSPLTAFEDIYSLLPGERLVFSDGKISKSRWWRIRFNTEEGYDEEYIKEKIVSLLEDATRLRMRSDVPFGAYLSGGVDSSAVVALMTRFSDRPVKTFSLGYEDTLSNKEADLYYARKVSEAYGTEHYERIMSHRDLPADIEDVIGAFDQPFSGTISTFFLSSLIRQHVKVALSGDGADELFGSYLTHRTATPMSHYSRLRKRGDISGFSKEERELLLPCDEAYLEGLYKKSSGDEALWRYYLYLFDDDTKRRLLSPAFMERVKGGDSLSLVRGYFEGLSATDPLNRILEMEWNTQLPDQMLAFADALSMAHSVEIRSPFLDYRLVEFAATIPGELKIRHGNVKDILKKAVEPLLPTGITRRPKEGFVLPVFNWLPDAFRGYALDLLSGERLRKHGMFNPDAVAGILRRFYGGEKELAGKVWNLMMFQVWWERYFA